MERWHLGMWWRCDGFLEVLMLGEFEQAFEIQYFSRWIHSVGTYWWLVGTHISLGMSVNRLFSGNFLVWMGRWHLGLWWRRAARDFSAVRIRSDLWDNAPYFDSRWIHSINAYWWLTITHVSLRISVYRLFSGNFLVRMGQRHPGVRSRRRWVDRGFGASRIRGNARATAPRHESAAREKAAEHWWIKAWKQAGWCSYLQALDALVMRAFLVAKLTTWWSHFSCLMLHQQVNVLWSFCIEGYVAECAYLLTIYEVGQM